MVNVPAYIRQGVGSNLTQVTKDFSLPGYGSVPLEQGDVCVCVCVRVKHTHTHMRDMHHKWDLHIIKIINK